MCSLRASAAAVVLVLLSLSHASQASQSPAPGAPTPDQIQAYEAFRAWITQQPDDVHRASDDVVFRRYEAELKRQGKPDKDIRSTIDVLKRMGDRAEVERWNRILTAPAPAFNTAPNAFLVEMIKGVKPGRSLDVGMGQGRNTVYLAQQGWESAGFDPADRAVAAARDQAAKLGVTIDASVARAEDFNWGDGQWDLIVLSYVGVREFAGKVVRALRPGGMVVVEAFHRDATKKQPIGGAVVFDTNELLKIFSGLRVVRYEDTNAKGDFGMADTRVVRLAAVKP
jgi:2-polyprenyl-3-methyl-5-hydroxy-6-metoxy-1,4-benzoquinol methylase